MDKLHLINLNPAEDTFGFFVWTGYAEDSQVETWLESGYSSAIYDILKDAFNGGYQYVRFDSDAIEDKNLPTFKR